MGEGREQALYLARGRDTHEGCVCELAGKGCARVSVLGKGVCAPATCEEGWCPMGGWVQAGSSWRGGGAAAGAGAALLSSQSQSTESIELELHEVWLLLPLLSSSGWSSESPLHREVWTRLDSQICSSETTAPPSLREFLCWALFLPSTLHCGAFQLGAMEIIAPWLCWLSKQQHCG